MDYKNISLLYARKDLMHNFSHILRLKFNANLISKRNKKVDMALLRFLILFHGLKDYVLIHKKDFPKKYILALKRHNNYPKTIEEKIVHDANLLDNIGKPGIKKAIYIGKSKGRSIKSTKLFVKRRLSSIRFYTKEGKKLGAPKIEEMKEWLSS